jgi:hypothetical protein
MSKKKGKNLEVAMCEATKNSDMCIAARDALVSTNYIPGNRYTKKEAEDAMRDCDESDNMFVSSGWGSILRPWELAQDGYTLGKVGLKCQAQLWEALVAFLDFLKKIVMGVMRDFGGEVFLGYEKDTCLLPDTPEYEKRRQELGLTDKPHQAMSYSGGACDMYEQLKAQLSGFISTEFAKGTKDFEKPLGAAGYLAGSAHVGQKAIQALFKLLHKQAASLGCYKQEVGVVRLCRLIADFIVPPQAALGAIGGTLKTLKIASRMKRTGAPGGIKGTLGRYGTAAKQGFGSQIARQRQVAKKSLDNLRSAGWKAPLVAAKEVATITPKLFFRRQAIGKEGVVAGANVVKTAFKEGKYVSGAWEATKLTGRTVFGENIGKGLKRQLDANDLIKYSAKDAKGVVKKPGVMLRDLAADIETVVKNGGNQLHYMGKLKKKYGDALKTHNLHFEGIPLVAQAYRKIGATKYADKALMKTLAPRRGFLWRKKQGLVDNINPETYARLRSLVAKTPFKQPLKQKAVVDIILKTNKKMPKAKAQEIARVLWQRGLAGTQGQAHIMIRGARRLMLRGGSAGGAIAGTGVAILKSPKVQGSLRAIASETTKPKDKIKAIDSAFQVSSKADAPLPKKFLSEVRKTGDKGLIQYAENMVKAHEVASSLRKTDPKAAKVFLSSFMTGQKELRKAIRKKYKPKSDEYKEAVNLANARLERASILVRDKLAKKKFSLAGKGNLTQRLKNVNKELTLDRIRNAMAADLGDSSRLLTQKFKLKGRFKRGKTLAKHLGSKKKALKFAERVRKAHQENKCLIGSCPSDVLIGKKKTIVGKKGKKQERLLRELAFQMIREGHAGGATNVSRKVASKKPAAKSGKVDKLAEKVLKGEGKASSKAVDELGELARVGTLTTKNARRHGPAVAELKKIIKNEDLSPELRIQAYKVLRDGKNDVSVTYSQIIAGLENAAKPSAYAKVKGYLKGVLKREGKGEAVPVKATKAEKVATKRPPAKSGKVDKLAEKVLKGEGKASSKAVDELGELARVGTLTTKNARRHGPAVAELKKIIKNEDLSPELRIQAYKVLRDGKNDVSVTYSQIIAGLENAAKPSAYAKVKGYLKGVLKREGKNKSAPEKTVKSEKGAKSNAGIVKGSKPSTSFPKANNARGFTEIVLKGKSKKDRIRAVMALTELAQKPIRRPIASRRARKALGEIANNRLLPDDILAAARQGLDLSVGGRKAAILAQRANPNLVATRGVKSLVTTANGWGKGLARRLRGKTPHEQHQIIMANVEHVMRSFPGKSNAIKRRNYLMQLSNKGIADEALPGLKALIKQTKADLKTKGKSKEAITKRFDRGIYRLLENAKGRSSQEWMASISKQSKKDPTFVDNTLLRLRGDLGNKRLKNNPRRREAQIARLREFLKDPEVQNTLALTHGAREAQNLIKSLTKGKVSADKAVSRLGDIYSKGAKRKTQRPDSTLIKASEEKAVALLKDARAVLSGKAKEKDIIKALDDIGRLRLDASDTWNGFTAEARNQISKTLDDISKVVTGRYGDKVKIKAIETLGEFARHNAKSHQATQLGQKARSLLEELALNKGLPDDVLKVAFREANIANATVGRKVFSKREKSRFRDRIYSKLPNWVQRSIGRWSKNGKAGLKNALKESDGNTQNKIMVAYLDNLAKKMGNRKTAKVARRAYDDLMKDPQLSHLAKRAVPGIEKVKAGWLWNKNKKLGERLSDQIMKTSRAREAGNYLDSVYAKLGASPSADVARGVVDDLAKGFEGPNPYAALDQMHLILSEPALLSKLDEAVPGFAQFAKNSLKGKSANADKLAKNISKLVEKSSKAPRRNPVAYLSDLFGGSRKGKVKDAGDVPVVKVEKATRSAAKRKDGEKTFPESTPENIGALTDLAMKKAKTGTTTQLDAVNALGSMLGREKGNWLGIGRGKVKNGHNGARDSLVKIANNKKLPSDVRRAAEKHLRGIDEVNGKVDISDLTTGGGKKAPSEKGKVRKNKEVERLGETIAKSDDGAAKAAALKELGEMASLKNGYKEGHAAAVAKLKEVIEGNQFTAELRVQAYNALKASKNKVPESHSQIINELMKASNPGFWSKAGSRLRTGASRVSDTLSFRRKKKSEPETIEPVASKKAVRSEESGTKKVVVSKAKDKKVTDDTPVVATTAAPVERSGFFSGWNWPFSRKPSKSQVAVVEHQLVDLGEAALRTKTNTFGPRYRTRPLRKVKKFIENPKHADDLAGQYQVVAMTVERLAKDLGTGDFTKRAKNLDQLKKMLNDEKIGPMVRQIVPDIDKALKKGNDYVAIGTMINKSLSKTKKGRSSADHYVKKVEDAIKKIDPDATREAVTRSLSQLGKVLAKRAPEKATAAERAALQHRQAVAQAQVRAMLGNPAVANAVESVVPGIVGKSVVNSSPRQIGKTIKTALKNERQGLTHYSRNHNVVSDGKRFQGRIKDAGKGFQSFRNSSSASGKPVYRMKEEVIIKGERKVVEHEIFGDKALAKFLKTRKGKKVTTEELMKAVPGNELVILHGDKVVRGEITGISNNGSFITIQSGKNFYRVPVNRRGVKLVSNSDGVFVIKAKSGVQKGDLLALKGSKIGVRGQFTRARDMKAALLKGMMARTYFRTGRRWRKYGPLVKKTVGKMVKAFINNKWVSGTVVRLKNGQWRIDTGKKMLKLAATTPVVIAYQLQERAKYRQPKEEKQKVVVEREVVVDTEPEVVIVDEEEVHVAATSFERERVQKPERNSKRKRKVKKNAKREPTSFWDSVLTPQEPLPWVKDIPGFTHQLD